MPNDFDMNELLATVNQLAQLAGKQIMEIYERTN